MRDPLQYVRLRGTAHAVDGDVAYVNARVFCDEKQVAEDARSNAFVLIVDDSVVFDQVMVELAADATVLPRYEQTGTWEELGDHVLAQGLAGLSLGPQETFTLSGEVIAHDWPVEIEGERVGPDKIIAYAIAVGGARLPERSTPTSGAAPDEPPRRSFGSLYGHYVWLALALLSAATLPLLWHLVQRGLAVTWTVCFLALALYQHRKWRGLPRFVGRPVTVTITENARMLRRDGEKYDRGMDSKVGVIAGVIIGGVVLSIVALVEPLFSIVLPLAQLGVVLMVFIQLWVMETPQLEHARTLAAALPHANEHGHEGGGDLGVSEGAVVEMDDEMKRVLEKRGWSTSRQVTQQVTTNGRTTTATRTVSTNHYMSYVSEQTPRKMVLATDDGRRLSIDDVCKATWSTCEPEITFAPPGDAVSRRTDHIAVGDRLLVYGLLANDEIRPCESGSMIALGAPGDASVKDALRARVHGLYLSLGLLALIAIAPIVDFVTIALRAAG